MSEVTDLKTRDFGRWKTRRAFLAYKEGVSWHKGKPLFEVRKASAHLHQPHSTNLKNLFVCLF